MDSGKQWSRAILSNRIAIGVMGKHLLEREDLGHPNRHSVPLRRGKVMSRKAGHQSNIFIFIAKPVINLLNGFATSFKH